MGALGDYPPLRREPPVFSECVIGYRRWMLTDWTLVPNSIGDPWRPGINHARCRTHDPGYAGALWAQRHASIYIESNPEPHTTPDPDCECGLYALHDLDLIRGHEPETIVFIIGAVAAWGRLEVHWDGFRAEYAQIVALVPPHGGSTAGGWPGLEVLQRVYQVPFVTADRLQAEAERHGRSLPADARPPRPDERYDMPPLVVGWGGAPHAVGTMMLPPSSPSRIPVATGMISPPPICVCSPARQWPIPGGTCGLCGLRISPRLVPIPPKPLANRQGPPRARSAPRFWGGLLYTTDAADEL
jgi:hypothetical protein